MLRAFFVLCASKVMGFLAQCEAGAIPMGRTVLPMFDSTGDSAGSGLIRGAVEFEK